MLSKYNIKMSELAPQRRKPCQNPVPKFWQGERTTGETVCPSGWHLPSNEDWDKLYRYAGGAGTGSPYSSFTAGKYLKATSGWNDYNGNSGNGTDAHGFSALPGGCGISGGGFGIEGSWWSSSEYDYDNDAAYYRVMYYDIEYAGYNIYVYKSDLYSVRCLKD
jgi:uncharacterized protein (TIGR02145 family)